MTWERFIGAVLTLDRHDRLRVDADGMPHPEEAGFYRSTGLSRAPLAHYRRPLSDGRGIHVHVYTAHYELHWDRWDPKVSLVRHLVSDVAHAVRRKLQGASRAALSAEQVAPDAIVP